MTSTADPDHASDGTGPQGERARFDSGQEPQPQSEGHVQEAADDAEHVGGDEVGDSGTPG